MPLSILRNDITKMKVDAIVNAANTRLQMGGGVCGAIFYAAGPPKLSAACDKLAPIKNGEAVVTQGFALPAKYVIHTAGPVYKGGNYNEENELRACYRNALERAKENNCTSIAFPLISSGIFGYPKDKALAVATGTIAGWLLNNESDMDVSIVVFDKTSFMLPQKLLAGVKAFIDENYIRSCETPEAVQSTSESFSQSLLRLIDVKGKKGAEVTRRANVKGGLFGKICDERDYTPGKAAVIAFAIALELSFEDACDLLARAGYTFSRSDVSDVIIQYFLTNGKYDIYEINNVLFEYDQPILGGGVF